MKFQRRRNDLISLLMYLTEKRIFFVFNHAFSDLTGRRDPEDFLVVCQIFSGIETRNSLMPPAVNRCAEHFAIRERKSFTGGSDAHTIASAGTAFTKFPAHARRRNFSPGFEPATEFRAGARERCPAAG